MLSNNTNQPESTVELGYIPDSMDALAQNWFMVGGLADGWRSFTNVGLTLHRRATLHWANVGPM